MDAASRLVTAMSCAVDEAIVRALANNFPSSSTCVLAYAQMYVMLEQVPASEVNNF